MNKLKIILLFIFALISSVHSQTLDEIITNHINAMGGADKLSTLHTARMTGTVTIEGTEIRITRSKSHLTGIRIDMETMGTKNYQIITPSGGKMFLPAQGMTKPVDMPADQLILSQISLDIQDVFLNYPEKGSTVELIGRDKVSGEDCYKLKLTLSNGLTAEYFISAVSNEIIKYSANGTINGRDIHLETVYSNYKQNSDGYWFAYTTTDQDQAEINYSNIETNITIDPNIFK